MGYLHFQYFQPLLDDEELGYLRYAYFDIGAYEFPGLGLIPSNIHGTMDAYAGEPDETSTVAAFTGEPDGGSIAEFAGFPDETSTLVES